MALEWCNSSLWPLWGASGTRSQALHRGGVVGEQGWNKLEGKKKGGGQGHKRFKERLSLWKKSSSGTEPREAVLPLSLFSRPSWTKPWITQAVLMPDLAFCRKLDYRQTMSKSTRKPPSSSSPFSQVWKKELTFIKNERLTNILAPISSSCSLSDKKFYQCPSFLDDFQICKEMLFK